MRLFTWVEIEERVSSRLSALLSVTDDEDELSDEKVRRLLGDGAPTYATIGKSVEHPTKVASAQFDFDDVVVSYRHISDAILTPLRDVETHLESKGVHFNLVVIDRRTARELALRYISQWSIPNDTLVIVDDLTIEKSYGWIFFYNSERWLATRDIEHAIAGNGPLVIMRASGELVQLGTADTEAIREFEKSRGLPNQ